MKRVPSYVLFTLFASLVNVGGVRAMEGGEIPKLSADVKSRIFEYAAQHAKRGERAILGRTIFEKDEFEHQKSVIKRTIKELLQQEKELDEALDAELDTYYFSNRKAGFTSAKYADLKSKIKTLIVQGANPNLTPVREDSFRLFSALEVAINRSDEEFFEWLLKNGASPNHRMEDVAITLAPGKFYLDPAVAHLLRKPQGKLNFVQMLIENGADVNATGDSQMTALASLAFSFSVPPAAFSPKKIHDFFCNKKAYDMYKLLVDRTDPKKLHELQNVYYQGFFEEMNEIEKQQLPQ